MTRPIRTAIDGPRRRAFRLLPTLLVAAMLAIGVGIEAVRFGEVLWQPKLALALLLALPWLGRRKT